MKYLPLIWAALWRKPVRAVLTLLSVAMAFMLFGIAMGFSASFDHLTGLARSDRIIVLPRFGGQVPVSLKQELLHMQGVKYVSAMTFLGGYYQDRRRPFQPLMFDTDIAKVWPELPLTKAQYAALKASPTGIFISQSLTHRFPFKTGDTIPLTVPPFNRADGTKTWPLKMLGTVTDIEMQPQGYAIGSFDYFDKSRPLSDQGRTSQFRVLIADPARGETTAKAIEGHFANSSTPMTAITEKFAYTPNDSGGIDLPYLTKAVSAAGLFMILFLAGNSIAQSVRERIPEFAVLKTIGFSDRGVMALVFAEAALPCLLGAGLGLLLAAWLGAIFPRLLPPGVGLPPPLVSPEVIGIALFFAVMLAAISAILPALRIARLDVATALSGR